jgi:hypothetical protein
LAAELNTSWKQPHFKACDGGIYTDTAEYIHDIPECTNLSVGYFDAHSSREELDTDFVLNMLESLCNVRRENLVIEREPTERKPRYSYNGFGHNTEDFAAYWEERYGLTGPVIAKEKPKDEPPPWNSPDYDWDDPAYIAAFNAWAADSTKGADDEPWPPPSIAGVEKLAAENDLKNRMARIARLEDTYGVELVQHVLNGEDDWQSLKEAEDYLMDAMPAFSTLTQRVIDEPVTEPAQEQEELGYNTDSDVDTVHSDDRTYLDPGYAAVQDHLRQFTRRR